MTNESNEAFAQTSAQSSAQAQIAPTPRISLQAFCETHDMATLIGEAAADRRLEKAHVKVNMGGANAAVEAYRTSPTPNVIVIESSTGRDELMSQLEALAEFCDSGTKVMGDRTGQRHHALSRTDFARRQRLSRRALRRDGFRRRAVGAI